MGTCEVEYIFHFFIIVFIKYKTWISYRLEVYAGVLHVKKKPSLKPCKLNSLVLRHHYPSKFLPKLWNSIPNISEQNLKLFIFFNWPISKCVIVISPDLHNITGYGIFDRLSKFLTSDLIKSNQLVKGCKINLSMACGNNKKYINLIYVT